MTNLLSRCLASAAACVLPLSAFADRLETENRSQSQCPFCEAINMTLAQRMKINDLVVTARLVEIPPPKEEIEGPVPQGRFAVQRIFKGENFIKVSEEFAAPLLVPAAVGDEFLCFGLGPPMTLWEEAIPSHPRVKSYLEALQRIPEKGPERLVFFQDYFEDELPVLAMDAYDEFAVASYVDLLGMRDSMNRPRLLELIKDRTVEISRRRLYLTLLGVCGKPEEDLPLLEKMLTSYDKKDKEGLDALVACYLSLKGPDGLPLIETQFLLNDQREYVAIQEVVSALRFHGTEAKIIPRDALVVTVRKLLDRPKLADIVIPDLARWEDWSVMPKLVQMFKEMDTKPNWARVPILQYLQACPLPEAKSALEELKKIDPDAYRRATFYSNLDFDDDQR